MRIYSTCYELMSETGRNLIEMGQEVAPLSYQDKDISGNPDFITKELICEQFCLTSLAREEALFVFSNAKEWADAEFEERVCNIERINPGEAWKLRPDLWEQFLINGQRYITDQGKEKVFHYTYNERLHLNDRLERVIEELKRNPDTRQAVVLIHGDSDIYLLGGKGRIPCSMYYDFLVRKNTKGERVVHVTYHMRSSDFVTHFGNDVYLCWLLMEYVANRLGYKPGYLYMNIDSLHSYQKDWVQLKTSIGNLL